MCCIPQQIIGDFEALKSMIEQTIDLEAVQRHEYILNSAFSSELEGIHHEKLALKKRIDSYFDKVYNYKLYHFQYDYGDIIILNNNISYTLM